MSSIKIKTPAMPEPSIKASAGVCCGNFTTGGEYMGQSEALCCGQPDEAYPDHYSVEQLAAINAQWLEMVGPLVEALQSVTDVYANVRRGLAVKYPADGWSAETMTIDSARAALSAITEE